MWGTTGFGYNVEQISARMADAPVNSWAMIFDPAIVSRFADCGVAMLDSPDDVVGIALNYLGFSPNSEDAAELAKAEALLMSIRPHIRYFHASQYISDLANGDICLAVGYSGDVLQAADRASEAGKTFEIVYAIPAEGTQLWFDNMAIPADAPNPANAHAFINFILEPQISADITNFVSYASGNAAALEFVDEEIRSNPAVFPPDEIKQKLYTLKEHSPAFQRLLTRTWTRVKTGR